MPTVPRLAHGAQGQSPAHHFAHPPGSTCVLHANGESGLHRRCKNDLYNALIAAGAQDVMTERVLPGEHPDISFTAKDGSRVVVEIQVSNISFETILHRTRIYTKLNAHILWVCPKALLKVDATPITKLFLGR